MPMRQMGLYFYSAVGSGCDLQNPEHVASALLPVFFRLDFGFSKVVPWHRSRSRD